MNQIVKEDIENIALCKEIDWMKFSNKRVLVSGASGFLASYLIETLLSLEHIYGIRVQITALIRSKERYDTRFGHHVNNPNLTMLLQDVCEPISLNHPHHFIIHAASQASPKYYGIDPVGTLKANILGTMNLLELARGNPIESFLYFSSGEVYGETNIFPIKETDYGLVDPVKIRACYAENKKMGENMCVAWNSQYQIPTKIIRPFHTYGPGVSLEDGRVFADFIKNVIEGEDIVMNSNGEAKRAFCYISDATKAFFIVLLRGKESVPYNIGNPDAELSIKDLAGIICKLSPEKKLKIINKKNSNSKYYLKSLITRNCPDITRVSNLQWSPQVNVRDGFKRTIESYFL